MLGRAQAYTVWPGYVNGISVGHHHDPFHSEESAWYDLVNDSSLPLKDSWGVEKKRWFKWGTVRGHAATSAVSH